MNSLDALTFEFGFFVVAFFCIVVMLMQAYHIKQLKKKKKKKSLYQKTSWVGTDYEKRFKEAFKTFSKYYQVPIEDMSIHIYVRGEGEHIELEYDEPKNDSRHKSLPTAFTMSGPELYTSKETKTYYPESEEYKIDSLPEKVNGYNRYSTVLDGMCIIEYAKYPLYQRHIHPAMFPSHEVEENLLHDVVAETEKAAVVKMRDWLFDNYPDAMKDYFKSEGTPQ